MSEDEALELEEIQGLILSGYGERPCAKYVVFAIDDPVRARAWLAQLVGRLQFGEFIDTPKGEPPYLSDVCLNLAFTYAGFARLGLEHEALLGFSGSFRGGMAAPHRARQLGDDGASAPESWRWGGPNTHEPHGVFLIYAGKDDGDPEEDAVCMEHATREVCEAHGLRALIVRDTLPIKQSNRAEHFGFADGIANPTLTGLTRSRKHDVIPNGEVLLGYQNVYGKLGLSPLVSSKSAASALLPESRSVPEQRDFGRNGSYLVFRELEQDVAAFWQHAERAAQALPEPKSPVWLASRMVGRWPNGVPVTAVPDDVDLSKDSSENAFGYHQHRDYYGAACPIGSHIRRTNPRDTMLPIPHDPSSEHELGEQAGTARSQIKDRHRLLRRGRLYGPRRADKLDLEQLKQADGVSRGLHFLCFVANIRRQFEFVQATWVLNPNFAGLSRDPDPLLGAQRRHPFSASGFVLPGCPARVVDDLPRVVETRGGAYFFMPSKSALRYLAALAPQQPHAEPALSADAHAFEVFERGKIERDAQTREPKRGRRAFHPKCHGIVRGTLTVDPALPSAWQTGLFVAGATYPAWVRFSSASFSEPADHQRDLHGLAIKLMNVPALPRASLFERTTQDFLLVDAPRLMARDTRELLEFDRSSSSGRLAHALHLLRHPAQALALAQITSRGAHPFGRTYNSITAFAYGERVVRWVVRLRHGQELVPLEAGSAPLRAALRAQLARGPVELELCVQNRGARGFSLERADLDWSVPEERVATLTLHPDGFDTRAQEELGEQLSFNPWHALAAHRPLGAINAARKIYRALYELRAQLNGKKPFEPSP